MGDPERHRGAWSASEPAVPPSPHAHRHGGRQARQQARQLSVSCTTPCHTRTAPAHNPQQPQAPHPRPPPGAHLSAAATSGLSGPSCRSIVSSPPCISSKLFPTPAAQKARAEQREGVRRQVRYPTAAAPGRAAKSGRRSCGSTAAAGVPSCASQAAARPSSSAAGGLQQQERGWFLGAHPRGSGSGPAAPAHDRSVPRPAPDQTCPSSPAAPAPIRSA